MSNILVFVNHDDASSFGHLMQTFTGVFHSADGSRHVTMPQVASRLKHAKEPPQEGPPWKEKTQQADKTCWVTRVTSDESMVGVRGFEPPVSTSRT